MKIEHKKIDPIKFKDLLPGEVFVLYRDNKNFYMKLADPHRKHHHTVAANLATGELVYLDDSALTLRITEAKVVIEYLVR